MDYEGVKQPPDRICSASGCDAAVSGLVDSAAGSNVLRVSPAVFGAHHFDDALEVIAERAVTSLRVASFSISRWERRRGVLRTLINVGELGPGEQRWPQDEEYPVADYRYDMDLLLQGRPYFSSIDDEVDSASLSLLRRLEKESQLAVPVTHEGAMWGELWVSGIRGRRFGADDVPLLEAIVAQVSIAIGKAELFSEVSRYAYQDPLTRVANRRALDECLHRLVEDRKGTPALLVCDVDGLKEVNDRDGRPAGDAVLRAAAGVLSDVASEFRASLVARLGGDELCVVLPAGSLAEAEGLACAANRKIAYELGDDITLCWGAAACDADAATARELIAAADAALHGAKRLGPGRPRLRIAGDRAVPQQNPWRRQSVVPGRRSIDSLIPRVVELLRQRRPATTLEALKLLTYELSSAANAAAWSISATTDDFSGIRTVEGIESALDPKSGVRVVEHAEHSVYPLANYPATAHALEQGCAFIAGVDLDGSDSAEVAVLLELGYRAVLGVCAFDGKRGYLLEIYSDTDHSELTSIAGLAHVLTHYCVQAVTGEHQTPRLQSNVNS